MPTASRWVDPEIYLTYKGVSVYRAYEDDDIAQGPLWYHFTLDCTSDDNHFDIRDLDVPLGPRVEPDTPFLTNTDARYAKASEEERDAMRKAWTDWHKKGGGFDQARWAILRDAIDKGLLVAPED